MTQYWCQIVNGNSHGYGLARPRGHKASLSSTFHQNAMSDLFIPAAATPAADPVDSDDRGDGFVTPTKERSYHELVRARATNCSPTSVVGSFDRQAHKGSRSHDYLSLGSSGVYDYVATGPNRKYKTEMCTNLITHGYCRFGENCHYAHSEAERHKPSVEDLVKEDRLLLPCSIWVTTGFCPYGHRCKNLHDPNVAANEDANAHVVLEHCVKAKRYGFTIPDRLYHHQLNSIRQTNPLVAPCIWENCRPSRTTQDSLDWMDTYKLVCNTGPGAVAVNANYSPGYSDIPSQVMVDELQKLCIVMQMRDTDDTHLDFTYAPNDCMNGQPCMVLQTRYFRLLDFTSRQQTTISTNDVANEVPLEVYHSGKSSSPDTFVCAHEVAFDSKGKRACNLSIWFDANITTCSTTKAKKVSKKVDPWHLDDKTGALFCMPKNEEFEKNFPYTAPPYVFMQPIDDLKAGHCLVKDILQHRVATILLARGFCFYVLPSLISRLGEDFTRMKCDLERWAWPKTSDLDHLSNTTEVRNQAEYSPTVPDGQKSAVPAIWKSFTTNFDTPEGSVITPSKRLRAFCSITKKTDSSFNAFFPRFECFFAKSSTTFPLLSHSEATWREILLGEGGEDRLWKRAIETQRANPKRNAARPSAEGHTNSCHR